MNSEPRITSKKPGNSYNGFSPEQRERKFKALKLLLKAGLIPPPEGPCALCGDPDSPVEYHSEDYSEPFIWESPGMYCLCRNCHRDKLHKRFNRVNAWLAFIAHVRRGGYARDLKNPSICLEIKRYREAMVQGRYLTLKILRPYRNVVGKEWFANLTDHKIPTTILSDVGGSLMMGRKTEIQNIPLLTSNNPPVFA